MYPGLVVFSQSLLVTECGVGGLLVDSGRPDDDVFEVVAMAATQNRDEHLLGSNEQFLVLLLDGRHRHLEFVGQR